jgi:hypothetical protein
MTVPLCMLLNAITGGTLVDGYGTTADTDTANFMLNVKIKIKLNTNTDAVSESKQLCNRFLFNLKSIKNGMLHNKFKSKGLTTAEVNRAREKYGENKTAYKKTICF